MYVGEHGYEESADRNAGGHNCDTSAKYGDSFRDYDGDSFESYSDDTLEEDDTETEFVSRQSALHPDNIVEELVLSRNREALDKVRPTVPNYRCGQAVVYPTASRALLAEIRATVPRRENNDEAFNYMPRQDKGVFGGSHLFGRFMGEESVERYRKKQTNEEVKKENEGQRGVNVENGLRDHLVYIGEATAPDNLSTKVSSARRTNVKGWWVKMKKTLSIKKV
jgi:hypothetical protein